MNKKLILEYYDFWDRCDGFLWVRNKRTGKESSILPDKKTIYLLLDADIQNIDKENIENLVKQGKAIKTNGIELYQNFSSLSKDKLHKKIYGYDERTKEYLDNIEKKIGLLSHEFGHKEEEFKIIKQYDFIMFLTGSGYIDVGKVAENKYVAQFSYRVSIDDYCIERIYFNRFPTEQDIKTAITINDIKTYLRLHPDSEIFTCWECGRELHWVDIDENDLIKKFEMLKEKYCGC